MVSSPRVPQLNGQKLSHIAFNQDGDTRRDNKRERVKGATEGQKLMLSAIAMQTHKRSHSLIDIMKLLITPFT